MRAAPPPGILGDQELLIHGQPAGLERLEDHDHGHELAHAGRLRSGSSAFFSKNTVPARASIRIACGAVVSNGGDCASRCRHGEPEPSRGSQNRGDPKEYFAAS